MAIGGRHQAALLVAAVAVAVGGTGKHQTALLVACLVAVMEALATLDWCRAVRCAMTLEEAPPAFGLLLSVRCFPLAVIKAGLKGPVLLSPRERNLFVIFLV